MLQAGVGCELDSRSVERIVDHTALPDSPAQTPQSPLPRGHPSMDRPGEKNRPMPHPNGVANGHFRNNSMVNSPIRAYQVCFQLWPIIHMSYTGAISTITLKFQSKARGSFIRVL